MKLKDIHVASMEKPMFTHVLAKTLISWWVGGCSIRFKPVIMLTHPRSVTSYHSKDGGSSSTRTNVENEMIGCYRKCSRLLELNIVPYCDFKSFHQRKFADFFFHSLPFFPGLCRNLHIPWQTKCSDSNSKAERQKGRTICEVNQR